MLDFYFKKYGILKTLLILFFNKMTFTVLAILLYTYILIVLNF